MGFSRKQLVALKRNLDNRVIRTRQANGRQLSYLEGWYVLSEANRIFGHDGWSRETLESRCVLTRENRGTFLAVYIARVRITVHSGGVTVIREGHGSGERRGDSPGEVHDIALKAAETDATKRALATFGKPFGLELYRPDRAPTAAALAASTAPAAHAPQAAINVTELDPAEALAALKRPVIPPTRVGFHPDDTTPIPRPSRYYGRRQAVTDQLQQQAREGLSSSRSTLQPADSLPLAPSLTPDQADPGNDRADQGRRIDKSVLAIPEPKRLRDKAHLKFVASQPCLICGRQPADPHHLRFAQPRAIGLKVSDEFTVPLCRGHHRQLHQVGDEVAWWDRLKINALEIARQLWEQTHPKIASVSEPNNVTGANANDQTGQS
jgi:hypothetical protein